MGPLALQNKVETSPYYSPVVLRSMATRSSLGRWWTLATYSIIAGLQGGVWSVPGVLEPALINVYGITGDTCQLLLNYGPIFYLMFAVPTMWAIDRFGIRLATGCGAALMLASNTIRLFAHSDDTLSLAALHLGYIFCAIAGPVAMAIPCKLAEDFFEPDQRTLATAIAALANQSGTCFVYLVVPLLSPGVSRQDVLRMDIFLASISLLACTMFIAYFPSHPLVAPSRSAAQAKIGEEKVTLGSLASATFLLAQNAPYLAITMAYSLTIGLSNCAGAMLTANIAPLGGNSSDSGYIGAAANGASLFIGIVLASFADLLKSRAPAGSIRVVLVSLLIISGAAFSAYALYIQGDSSGGRARLWTAAAAFVVANVSLSAFIPLAFDAAAEFTFPAPEGTMLMLVTFCMNLVSMGFLFAPASSFFSWANYGVVACCFSSAALLAFALPKNLPRWDFDVGAVDIDSQEGEKESTTASLLLNQ